MIYVKFINSKIGYGVFAKVDLEANVILGEYTGYISKDPKRKAYCWTYSSSFENYEKISIDAVNGSTMLRFVNDLEDHNLTVLNVPIRN